MKLSADDIAVLTISLRHIETDALIARYAVDVSSWDKLKEELQEIKDYLTKIYKILEKSSEA